MVALVLLALFVAIPIAEIVVLIEVGSVIGTVPTIALIILTAVTGMVLIRHQGLGVIADVRRGMDAGEPPINPLIDGLFLLVAGALLLTPGFITDSIGLICLVPPLRRLVALMVWRRLAQSGHAQVIATARRGSGPADIEGDYVDLTPGTDEPPGEQLGEQPGNPDSPWSPDEKT